ncbi:MAG: glycosyltransferase family 2 protein [Prevotella sp.]|nr:glycosyltransferase family 2 protein [Prevotella sp.]
MWTTIHIIDILLWVLIAVSVIYVSIYAFASLFHRKRKDYPTTNIQQSSFLIIFPAYREDAVIVNSVKQFLEQSYSQEQYHVAVVSDHMKDITNQKLKELPITLLTPQFEKSSKAKALQYTIEHIQKNYDYVVILDADNVVLTNFLEQLNASCQQGYQAIQCHRCAKNSDNDVAILDGASEEINNTIFRKAHNTIGLSSALIGSGMCFTYQWFKQHVNKLESAVEDREMEAALMKENIYIKFEENIHVFDEKVSNHENFERQRQRWLNGQIQTLLLMLPYIPKAIATLNINYIDKTIQQALIPRSILLVIIPFLAFIILILSPIWSIKWWGLFLLLCISLFIAIPSQMRTSTVFRKLISLPKLVIRMLRNILHIDKNNKEFFHTTHEG